MTLPPKTRYPGYDVLDKWSSPSWDAITRAVMRQRLAPHDAPRFFDAVQWQAVQALCACIVPQRSEPSQRQRVPLPAMLDAKLLEGGGDGYRDSRLPDMRQAWRIGLAALDAASRERHALPVASIDEPALISLLDAAQAGALQGPQWRGMPSDLFFSERVLHDICGLYYSHPYAWSEIGFGGPANPRGYVRMYDGRRDPWEAVQAKPGDEAHAYRKNRHVR